MWARVRVRRRMRGRVRGGWCGEVWCGGGVCAPPPAVRACTCSSNSLVCLSCPCGFQYFSEKYSILRCLTKEVCGGMVNLRLYLPDSSLVDHPEYHHLLPSSPRLLCPTTSLRQIFVRFSLLSPCLCVCSIDTVTFTYMRMY